MYCVYKVYLFFYVKLYKVSGKVEAISLLYTSVISTLERTIPNRVKPELLHSLVPYAPFGCSSQMDNF